jgi:hypothetical protein
VSRARLRRYALVAVALVALAAAAGASGRGALVEVDNLILRADGAFEPRKLPRGRFVPLEFEGHASITSKDGTRPVPLRQLIVDFDHDGRISVEGLPTCPPARIANATVAEARQLCRGALVGEGEVRAQIALTTGLFEASSPLTVFNGPPLEGRPSAVLHAHFTEPGTQTFAIPAPIERRRGEYRYRVTLDLPPIAAGLGSLSAIEVEIGRRYRFEGKRRSYVSARCSDNLLRTHGRFSFEDGTVIDGAVTKFCYSLPPG